MYTPFLRISEIPTWLPDGHIRAQRYHLQRFQRWLLTAGASPRMGMVLATENEGLSAVFAELLLGGIEIQQCTSSPRRPLPEKLLRHQGDHFNRTLFVIDGLDSYGDDWSMLEQYLHHFARTATWVLFRLREPRQLRILQKTAPNLFGRLERCLPIYQEGKESVPQNTSRDTVPQLIFDGLLGRQPIHYFGWSRWLRTGFGHQQTFLEDNDLSRAYHLWRNGELDERGAPLSLESSVRERHIGVERFPLPMHEFLAEKTQMIAAQIAAFRQACRNGRAINPEGLIAHMEQSNHPDLRVEINLALAEAALQEESWDQVERHLDAACSAAETASLEVRFEAFETSALFFAACRRFPAAQRLVDALMTFEHRLMSPYYEARLLVCRGTLVSHLDVEKGRELFSLGCELFREHGYPARAQVDIR